MKRSRFPLIITILVLSFLYLPTLILVINSFNLSKFNGVWLGFSLKWYQKLFEDSATWDALANSLFIAVTATITAIILGTMAAFGLYRYKTNLQTIQYGLITSPLVVPDILMGISLLLLFIAGGLNLGLITVYLAHGTFCISYIAMTVLSKLETFDYSVVEAGQDLGASNLTIARKIVIPLLAPGILSGALLAFTISFDDYIITSFVAGPGATTLPLHIYGLIKFGSTPVINALSTIILSVTFVIVLLIQYLTREKFI